MGIGKKFNKLHQNWRGLFKNEELLKAIAESPRSYEEILRFIQGTGEEETGKD